MTRRSERAQTARHIQINDDDWEYLKQVYGPGSPQPIGPGPAIRTIIQGFVKRLRQQTIDRLDTQGGPER